MKIKMVEVLPLTMICAILLNFSLASSATGYELNVVRNDPVGAGLNELNVARNNPKDAECRLEKDVYTCRGVPNTIPPNITAVTVNRYMGTHLERDIFNQNWTHVKRLYFTGKRVVGIAKNTFCGIPLTELMLTLPKSRYVNIAAFVGLDSLEKLDFIDMVEVGTSDVFKAISVPKVATQLKYLTFTVGMLFTPPRVKLTDDVLENLFTTKPLLVSLNVSNVVIQCQGLAKTFLFALYNNVSVLNVSGSFIDAPTETVANPRISSIPHFNTIDFSRISHPFNYDQKQSRGGVTYSYREIYLFPYLLLAEYVYANYLYREDSIIETSVDYTNYTLFWKSLYFKGNNLKFVNCSWKFNNNNNFKFIDLSENKLEYVSKTFLSSFIHMQTLLISQNQLFRMQFNSEFGELLESLRSLTTLDASFNNLSFSPLNTFSANDKLAVLKLGFNQFTTIMFSLDNMRSLEWLDLQSNLVENIEGDALSRLSSYVRSRINTSETFGFKLSFDGNPIVCACRSVLFIELLEYITSLNESLNGYACLYEGKTIPVDGEALRKSKYLCIKGLITILSVVVSVFVFAIVVIVGVVIHRKYKRHRKANALEIFIRTFKDRQMTETHLVFMAFASNDEEFVENHLLPTLDKTLRARIASDARVVSTGADFQPGHHITEEIHRCMSQSCVLVAVISDSFCSSRFCEAEIREAGSQTKPVILLFLEEVEQARMSPYMREIFNRTARAKVALTAESGEATFEPSLENICESVINLAIKHVEH